jgi:uncharacterized damage-inducible protein DinB
VLFTVAGLMAFHQWTHESLAVVFKHAENLPHELFVRELSGFGVASIRDQFVHILEVEQGWVRNLQRLPSSKWISADFPTVSTLNMAKARIIAGTVKYLEGLSDADLNRSLESCPEGWVGPAHSPAFILHHVFTHSFHHKGQTATMFRLLGFPVGDSDLQR